MIILHSYFEFGQGMGYPSMKEYFEKDRYQNQDAIVQYLKGGTDHMAVAGIPVDVITGAKIDVDELTFKNDGKYSWISTLAYYVDKYNLRLPKEFEKHVLQTNALKRIA